MSVSGVIPSFCLFFTHFPFVCLHFSKVRMNKKKKQQRNFSCFISLRHNDFLSAYKMWKMWATGKCKKICCTYEFAATFFSVHFSLVLAISFYSNTIIRYFLMLLHTMRMHIWSMLLTDEQFKIKENNEMLFERISLHQKMKSTNKTRLLILCIFPFAHILSFYLYLAIRDGCFSIFSFYYFCICFFHLQLFE